MGIVFVQRINDDLLEPNWIIENLHCLLHTHHANLLEINMQTLKRVFLFELAHDVRQQTIEIFQSDWL